MTSTDAAYKARWTLLHAEGVVGKFVRGNAIPDYFCAHPEIGSPITVETDWDGVDGGRIQSFSSGIVGWDPANGAREVTG